ncbi:hypothetical protein [Nonomuraea indica]|uniref:hypothetical protein n=1 Tax=Nonomuraea indica TaxID=1581193 RepID=UPI000C7E14A0|nr:hypothetical protein [Nonomuraea indica]
MLFAIAVVVITCPDVLGLGRAILVHPCLRLDGSQPAAGTGYEDVEVEGYTGVFTDGLTLPMLAAIAQAALAAGAITQQQHDAWVAEQSERARHGRSSWLSRFHRIPPHGPGIAQAAQRFRAGMNVRLRDSSLTVWLRWTVPCGGPVT